MLTNNYQTKIVSQLLNSTGQGKNTSGASVAIGSAYGAPTMSIGTGTTAPKRSDYKLESEIDINDYEVSFSKSYTTAYDSENSYVNLIATFTNKSNEPIHVSEVGLVDTGQLLAREVFDTPITLGVGETKSFVLKLF